MTILQDYATQIYAEINGRKSFALSDLEEDLSAGKNNFRQLRNCPLVELVRPGKPNRYALKQCSLEAFKEALAIESDTEMPRSWVGVKRVENTKMLEQLEILHTFAQRLHNTIKEMPYNIDSPPSIPFNTEKAKTAIAATLQWLEQYELDPRSVADDTRWACFLLEEE